MEFTPLMIMLVLILVAVVSIPVLLAFLFWPLLRGAHFPRAIDVGQVQGDHVRLLVVEQQITLFWRLVEQSLAGRLHAPTHHKLDGLLAELQNGTIEREGLVELRVLIHDRQAELVIEGAAQPELDFPRLMTLWAIDVRLGTLGQDSAVSPTMPPRLKIPHVDH